MFSRLLRVTVPVLGAFATFDAGKVLVQGVLLRKIRANNPAMFDGAIAAEQVRLALLDATVPPPR